MKTADVQSLVGRVSGVDAGCTDWGVLKAGVADLRLLKSWVEGREVAFAQQIAKVSSFPEKSLAEAGNTSLRQGGRLLERAGYCCCDTGVRCRRWTLVGWLVSISMC